jgi:hypothetical protein
VIAETKPFFNGVFLQMKLTGFCNAIAATKAQISGRRVPKAYLKNR